MSEAPWRAKVSIQTLRTETNQINKLFLFGNSGDILAEGFANGNISVVPVKSTGTPLQLNEHKDGVFAFTTFNNYLISGGGDSYIKVS